MRILMVGAGGVGSAAAKIAARRVVLRGVRGRRLRRGPGRSRWSDELGDDRFVAAQVDASDAEAVARLAREHGATHVLNAVDPRFVMPIFDGALAAGADYLDMAMSLSAPAPRPSRTSEIGVKLGDEQFAQRREWEAAGPARARRHRRRAGAVRRVRALRRRPPVQRDRRARRARRRQPRRCDGYDVRAVVLHLDHDRGVPQPAGDLGEGPRLVHHRRRSPSRRSFDFPEGIGPVECVNVEHEEVLLMPRWVDAQAGHVQVRPRRRVHRRAQDAAQARPRPHRARCASAASRCRRATWSPPACPTRPRSATAMHGKTCAGHLGHRHGQGRRAARGVPVPRGRQRVDDGASTARRPWSGRPRSTRSSRSSCSPTGTWSGAGVLGPEAFDAAAVPGPAHRVRLARGACRSATRRVDRRRDVRRLRR